MKLIKFQVAAIIILHFIYTSFVVAEGFDYLSQVKKYVKCEAVFNVAANISSKSEEEFYEHELHHASIDARIIALELAKVGKISAEQVNELFYAYLNEYRKVLEEREANNQLDDFINLLNPVVGQCEQLNAMQQDILQRKKEQIDYSEYQ